MNLEVNEKQFPKGMKQLADDIRALGFKPGIWVAPFGTGNEEFYKAHKDWFIHAPDGTPKKSWNGIYTLDPTVPEAVEHLKKIFTVMSKDWGYEFFKVDGMSGRNRGYCAHMYEVPDIRALFKNPSCPNPFELCVKAFREGMGEDRIFLACQGHSSGAEAAFADSARTGADIVHPNQPVKWQNVLLQARCTINQIFTHNISMIADPDTLLVRDLPTEEARVSATIVSLPGQLTFFGDKLGDLSSSQMKILQQTLPVTNVRPVSLYPYFSMLPIWNLAIKNTLIGDYNVVAFFNWEDVEKVITVGADELGIDATKKYVGKEFWTGEALSSSNGIFAMKVPAHAVRVVALHAEKNIPQWISSDRHITQNAQEIKAFKFDEKTKTIDGKIELIEKYPLTIHLNLPAGYSIEKVSCENASTKISESSIEFTSLSETTTLQSFKVIFK